MFDLYSIVLQSAISVFSNSAVYLGAVGFIAFAFCISLLVRLFK